MARRTGQVDEDTGKVETKRMRRVKEVEFPVTVVNTRAKRMARNLWG